MSLPTFLTSFRILLIPVLVVVYYLPTELRHFLAAVVFATACITDWLDGYLARTLKQVSAFGAFLDPVADKLVVVVALVLILGEKCLPNIVLPAAIIVGREITISSLREWMSEMGRRASVAVTWIGKIKTFVQMLALTLLLAYHPSSPVLIGLLGYIFLYISAILTLYSMFVYLKLALIALKGVKLSHKI